MFIVIKRDGRREGMDMKKLSCRIGHLCEGLDSKYVSSNKVVEKVSSGVYNEMRTTEIDSLSSEVSASLTTIHPEYAILAGRIAVSSLHKETKSKFSKCIEILYNNINENGQRTPSITKEVYETVMKHSDRLDNAIDCKRDFTFNYFGFKTLERSYLLKSGGKIVERPQYLFMRVAIGIHGEDIDSAVETYEYLSLKRFIHASPTLFHAGTILSQLSSCFLLGMKDDSIEGIFETLKSVAIISKNAGGIGVHIHNIRATGTPIHGTGGHSNGLAPMLKVFNSTAKYVDQGGNKRPGAVSIYLEPWHADIFDFLDLKKNTGIEEARSRDLFYGLWIPDLFMNRVEEDGVWSLFCPTRVPLLLETWGEKFEDAYKEYERIGVYKRQVRAQELWNAILTSQIETGIPYMLYKDACNSKSNHKNLGVIKGSNLCTEIIEYSDGNEFAVCNLASLALPSFFIDGEYSFKELGKATEILVRNLNKVIDINRYPLPQTHKSNLRHRPIGLGVQGLADVFFMMKYPFDSPEARELNKKIFETIYYYSLKASCELASKYGPYSSYEGSPVSQGILQHDMWNVTPSDLHDWDALRDMIKKHGVRNSLLVAPMPTASTSQILGFNECFEAYTSNIYVRRVLSGEFQIVNPYLLKDLIKLNLWNDDMRRSIIEANGSIASIKKIPEDLRHLYRTVWEISQKGILDMAADRGAFIDQSQSLNIHLSEPTFSKITSMHFYGWRKGLKTGMYYLRTRPAAEAVKFTIAPKPLVQCDDDISGCAMCSG